MLGWSNQPTKDGGTKPFGDKEFLQAYEWWLREKAEWMLEHHHGGGPVESSEWAGELIADLRVQAAYNTALDIGAALGDKDYARDMKRQDFARHFKRIVEAETVPDKRTEFKQKHNKLRGIDSAKTPTQWSA